MSDSEAKGLALRSVHGSAEGNPTREPKGEVVRCGG